MSSTHLTSVTLGVTNCSNKCVQALFSTLMSSVVSVCSTFVYLHLQILADYNYIVELVLQIHERNVAFFNTAEGDSLFCILLWLCVWWYRQRLNFHFTCTVLSEALTWLQQRSWPQGRRGRQSWSFQTCPEPAGRWSWRRYWAHWGPGSSSPHPPLSEDADWVS